MEKSLRSVERELGVRLPADLHACTQRRTVATTRSASGGSCGRLRTRGGKPFGMEPWATARIIPLGDDGTGEPFYIDLVQRNVEVLRWSVIDNAPQGSEGSIAEFVAKWVASSA